MKNSQSTFLGNNNSKKTPHWPWGLWSLTPKFNGLSKPVTAELKLENQFHLLLLLLWMTPRSIWKDGFSSTAWGKMLSTERKTAWAAHPAHSTCRSIPLAFWLHWNACSWQKSAPDLSATLWFSMSLSVYVTHTHIKCNKYIQNSNTNILENTTCIFTCVLITGTFILNSF